MTAAAATLGWSVNNIMRYFGVTTKATVLTAWVTAETRPGQNVTLPTSGDVDAGVTFLVANAFASYNSGTDTITPTNVDSSGKPARLRRVPGNKNALEFLPNGAPQRDGT